MHGLPDDKNTVEEVAMAIWRQLTDALPPNETEKCAVTHVPSRSFNRMGKRVPFLRVYSDKPSDFEVAREILRPVMLPTITEKVIEYVLLAKCTEE